MIRSRACVREPDIRTCDLPSSMHCGYFFIKAGCTRALMAFGHEWRLRQSYWGLHRFDRVLHQSATNISGGAAHCKLRCSRTG